MNILWISFYGSWTLPLLHEISSNNTVGVIIPHIGGKKNLKEEKEGITFYSVAFSKQECYRLMNLSTFIKYKQVIDEFKPDIIHVHGTEKNLAQIQNFIKDIPIVISIQGLLTGYKPYSSNYIDIKEIKRFRTLKNYLGWGGINLMYKYFSRGSVYESDILIKGKYFIGRTNWDKAHVLFNNPQAHYYHGEELLRPEFYKHAASWNTETCRRNSIFMPSGFNPIKGLYLAIETIHLLKPFFPDIMLIAPGLNFNITGKDRLSSRIWGEEYMIYCKHLIKKYDLKNNITILPKQDANGMIQQMKTANVFLSPSSIDNSPNAVGEATMIGIPIVTTPVGGVTSFMTDNTTALFGPAGDPYAIAYQIKRIFDSDELAINLSANAYQLALIRHDRVKIAEQYLNIYQTIINENHK
ncbi:glycosyltransferase [Bacteroides clarus]|uniref:glycosyltransferase n=1 Tax=Bacteroides clarus TaxID=626929 RepID=UPI001897EF83|nr:glycosyltransferase [Bacteroides clarus]